MKTKGIVENKVCITVNRKEIWKDRELIDFSLWNQEYDLRMKAEDHLVLSNYEVEVLNRRLSDELVIMDIDMVTSNIHVIPNGCSYGEVLVDFYNQYIKDEECEMWWFS